MWILECDGDILRGKKVWLRPGKTYLFGRTKPDGSKYAGFRIEHKTVSRKHMTLSVSAVKPGAGSSVHMKSELRLEDEKTKIGTEVDGERIRGESRVLKNDVHAFRLGSYEHLFRIKWLPVVLTFTFPSKDVKGKDPLIPVRSRLEDLDIKMILPYVIGTTTHVVAAKRNTAKGLQALINGKYIVDNTFLDALVYATTPGNLDELESLSPLEEDFEGSWPPEDQHLPAPGKEPGQRASELFAPDPARKEIFEGYAFVFCNQKQYENLQAPIANGNGKALYLPVTMGETSVGEIVRYVKNLAGEEDLGEFADGSMGKGVVLVKFQGDKGFEDWAIELQDQVALTLDQRLIEQNEFLDAILVNDASKLRRSLPTVEDDDTIAPPPRAVSLQPTTIPQTQYSVAAEATSPAQPELSQAPSRRVRPRGMIASAFKGFDDGFDPSQIAPEKKPFGSSLHVSGTANGASQNGFPDANCVIEEDSEDADGPNSHVRSARKRPLPSDDEEEEQDTTERLLPAAAAMKRRRIEEEKEAQRKGVSAVAPPGLIKNAAPQIPRKPKARKEVDIQEVVRQQREADDEAARRDEETFKEQINGMDVESMRNLAVIEEMEIPERDGRSRQRKFKDQNNDRWDEKWNGRKNFKKFQRSGEGERRRRGPSLIVPLEEVKKKNHGIGEEYWLESDKSTKKRTEKDQVSQPESQPFATARSQQVEVSSELVAGGDTEVVDVEAPRTTRLMDKTTQSDQGSNATSTQNGKRPAPAGTNGGAVKRQKIFAPPESDSDSENDLKFRFKKRI